MDHDSSGPTPAASKYPDDLDEREARDVARNYPRQVAVDEAYAAAKIEGRCSEEEARRIADSVKAALERLPELSWFPATVQPGHNTDCGVQVSLNGRLLRVTRDNERVGEELYGLNWHQFDNLTGRLLTLCDATFTDPTQRKAFKDMVRQHIKEWVTACIVDASADAGIGTNLTAPFVGGVLDQDGGLYGVEGGPTP